ncbi:multidrug efflux system subunit MdtA [Escherichia coli]|uniref:Multidrug efflux system subunit MdtA n=1 Tax=Escherichia coli TaxID=562 RepID=A0A376TDF4_ECOLX|nr:multidrug efflux system subunit MdtA [Escherichia coli]
MCPPFRRFPIVFHNSSIFLPYWLATLVSFRETFQEEKLLTMKGSYKSRWVIVIVVVIAAIAAFWFWQGRNDSQSAAPGATKQAQQSPAGGRRGMRSGPLAPVQAATAVEQAVPRYLTGLGTITAANTVTVRSRVDGQLMALHFQEGQQVKAGDLLAEIDPSQFKVALAQAQGQLAKDKATLANARRDLARYQQLAKPISSPVRSWMPNRRWSVKPKAPLRLMKQASPARSCNSTGAASPHQSMVALVSSRLMLVTKSPVVIPPGSW